MPVIHARRAPRFALCALSMALLPLCASANQSLSMVGYGLTTGPVFNRSNVGSAAYNPANALRLVADDEQVRLGILEFGARYEIGAVENVVNLKDSIQADIDRARLSNDAATVQSLATNINSVYLPALESGARGSIQAKGTLLTPLLWRTEQLPGVWSLSANAQLQASGVFRGADMQASVLFSSSDPTVNGQRLNVSLTGLGSRLTDLQAAATSNNAAQQQTALQSLTGVVSDPALLQAIINSTGSGNAVGTTYAVTSASAFDFKVAQVNQISLGFSREVTAFAPPELLALTPGAKLDAGLRLNLYQAQLYRQLGAFVDAGGNTNKIELNSDRSYRQNASAVGLDLGAMWNLDNYQFGATLYNLNGPKLQYPSPANDPNPANRSAAQQLAAAGKISLDDAVQLKPHLVLEGSVHSSDKRWLAQGSLAVNPTTDFVGDAQKYLTLSLSFNAERFETAWLDYILPSVRMGYRRNLVGSQLSSIGLGLSWGVLNLDLNTSLQKVQADGSTVPRSAGVALSIAEKF